jgi:hypothetical protein
MKVRDGKRENPGQISAAERYRRWVARPQVRVKWWSKSPPRIRVTGRHGKPRVVQDRTGKGLPVRSFPGISRTLRKQGAPLRRGERNGRPAPQGVDRIRLTGERHSLRPRAACMFQGTFAPEVGSQWEVAQSTLAHDILILSEIEIAPHPCPFTACRLRK